MEQLDCCNIADGSAIQNGPLVADKQWHFVVICDDNTAFDGLKQKYYLDGNMVGAISTLVGPTVVPTANGFRIGDDAGNLYAGQIGGAFVCNYALTPEQVRVLWNKSGFSIGNRSPVDPIASMVERYDDTSVYMIVPPDISGTDYLELEVSV